MSSIASTPTPEQVGAALQILESKTAPPVAKQQAFDTVKQSMAPDIHLRPEYAAELARVFGLRLPLWPPPPSFQNTTRLADRLRGLVFGNALGDAIGLATEFLTRTEIAAQYGPKHLFTPAAPVKPDFHRLNFPHGDWTDDSDQMILILQTMLEHGGRYHGPTFAQKLLQWKDHGFGELGDAGGAGCGQSTRAVMRHAHFLSNPRLAAQQVWEKSGRTMAPNGAVMRTSVTGLPFFWDVAIVQATTRDFCTATHADPRCVVSCLVVSEIVRQVLVQTASKSPVLDVTKAWIDDLIEQALTRSLAAVPELDKHAEQELQFYAHCTNISDLQLDAPLLIGYTYKCMGSGLWALRRAAALHAMTPTERIQQVFQELVREGGDADTNGAVAGALLGVVWGYQALPWTHEMPYGGWLEAWIQKVLFMLRLPIAVENKELIA